MCDDGSEEDRVGIRQITAEFVVMPCLRSCFGGYVEQTEKQERQYRRDKGCSPICEWERVRVAEQLLKLRMGHCVFGQCGTKLSGYAVLVQWCPLAIPALIDGLWHFGRLRMYRRGCKRREGDFFCTP